MKAQKVCMHCLLGQLAGDRVQTTYIDTRIMQQCLHTASCEQHKGHYEKKVFRT